VSGSDLTVSGGTSATGQAGGADFIGLLTMRRSTLRGNMASVHAGTGAGVAVGGGASFSDQASVAKSTFDGNRVSAESNSSNATGVGGGIVANDLLMMDASTLSRNTVDSTSTGATQAASYGGGIYLTGAVASSITNSTIANNSAVGTADLVAGTSIAVGGGISSATNSLDIVDATIARSSVEGQGNTMIVLGGGIFRDSGALTLEASILARNVAPGGMGPNCFNAPTSDGYNVLGTDAGCGFGSMATDKLNKNPRLEQLGNNGGPTQTIGLKDGSPALNMIPKADCPISRDQRGVHRPQGRRCDAGSYEEKL
jgi:hypothetical protein